MPLIKPFRGILPALQLPYSDDFLIDEPELRRFARWLAGHDGIGGLVTNGHTGEVFALSAEERAEVTRIVADEVGTGAKFFKSISSRARIRYGKWRPISLLMRRIEEY